MNTNAEHTAAPQTAGLMCESVADTGAHGPPAGSALHSKPKSKTGGRIRRALAAGLIALTAASTMGVAANAAPATAAPGVIGEQTNGYRGVWVEVKNRTHSKVIYVKDRHSGAVKMIPGGGSATWAEAHKSAGDEIELAAYYDHRVDDHGVELDAANAKGWWPTFSVNGDVENFSTDEMKVFNPGDGGRYVVTRISDTDDHKRFVVEVTPPGPIEEQAPAQSATTPGGAATAPAPKPATPAQATAPKPATPAQAPAPKPAAPAATDSVTRHAGAMPANDAPAAPTAPTAPNAPAAPAAQPTAQAPESQSPEFFNTRGTHVGVGNGGDQPIWIQKWYPSGGWGKPIKLNPGEWTSHSGDYPVIDDVEMRAYFSEADAQSESNNIDIDAENPAATTPWLSVDWDSEYFSVGGKHTWITDEGHRFDGERHADSKHNIEFRLVITPR